MQARTLTGCLVLLLAASALADVYLHSPRGSNNRLAEENRERNNANRLFDSQNNDRGGYNVGSVYYLAGSTMFVEWTNQHSCGGPNANCELIFQYMCDARVRDGTTTNTIPTKVSECNDYDCDTDVEYGRQESYDWYQNCRWRERNGGLFWASQTPQGNSARFTRQNNAGTRRGYECPEERDYYPYWHPSPWKDIAILTNDDTRCAAYQAESQNVKGRWFCDVPMSFVQKRRDNEAFIPITKDKCEALNQLPEFTATNATKAVWRFMAPWKDSDPSVAAPICRKADWSRDNHLGNGKGGFPLMFNWTIPDNIIPSERCVFRLRYNISTGDYMGWAAPDSIQAGVNANNSRTTRNGNANQVPANLDVWSKYGLSYTDVAGSFPVGTNPATARPANDAELATSRDYVLKNNPKVDIFGEFVMTNNNKRRVRLQLAINTAQYGRTFQDRSHRFAFRPRPATIPKGANVHNIQVRGKRGNIVQTFPAVEYDFIPNRMYVGVGDFVHFQWTGSNTNPNNNAGQGKAGTDRSNVVVLGAWNYDEYGLNKAAIGHWGNLYPGMVTDGFLGFSTDDIKSLANLNQFGGSMDELNDASTYFDLGPRKVTKAGLYYYYCTRNTNFSNRSQKGMIQVSEVLKATGSAAISGNGGFITLTTGAKMVAEAGVVSQLQYIQMSSLSKDTPTSLKDVNSDYLQVNPTDMKTDQKFTLYIPVNSYIKVLSPRVYRADSINGDFTVMSKDSYTISGDQAQISTDQGGVYVVKNDVNSGAVAGIVVGSVAFIAIVVVAVILYKRRQAAAADLGRVANSRA